MSSGESFQPSRLRLSQRFGLMLLMGAIAASQAVAVEPAIKVARGKGEFVFVDKKGDASKQIPVYSYLPEKADATAAPILFVMHGHHKTAKGYRDNWAVHADKYGFMVFAPLFDEEQWGHGQYSYASVIDRHGRIRNPSLWSFNVIEHLFDAIKAATGNRQPRYFIFGFSEGGQFVHRLVLLLPEARYARAIVGSPGWYTMPTFDVKYPYGLGGAPATVASLKMSLGRDVVLLLGEEDNDPNHPELRKTREAMAQGDNRFARGQTFFREAKHRAAELKTPFAWRIRTVPGAEHHPKQVTATAAALFMGR